MSFLTTWTFAPQEVFPGETLQLIFEFTHTYAPAAGDFPAPDGMRVKSWGDYQIGYDMEDALLAINNISFVLGDENGDLDNWLFGTTPPGNAAQKNVKATVIRDSGLATEFTLITALFTENSIESDYAAHSISFKIMPDTAVINKKMVFNESVALDPLSIGDMTVLFLGEYLEKIYQLVDAAISYAGGDIVIRHDWLFKGQSTTPLDGNVWYDGIRLDELKLSSHYLFFSTTAGVRTCGDVLRLLAKMFCSFTGIYKDKVFFNKLFWYDETNIQTPEVLSHKKGYRYGLLDYIKVTTHFGTTETDYEEPSHDAFTALEDRFMDIDLVEEPLTASVTRANVFYVYCTGITTAPTEGATYIDTLGLGTYVVVGAEIVAGAGYLTLEILTGTIPALSGSIDKLSGTGDATIAYNPRYSPLALDFATAGAYGGFVLDLKIDSNYIQLGAMVAKYWYEFRGKIQNCRVDKFIFRGINTDFLKNFPYLGGKFQILTMKIKHSNHTTEAEAIYLGELT